MEINAVDARDEEEIDFGLALGETCPEMFGKPSERFGADVFLARDVSSRRSVLQHRQVGVVDVSQRILAEALDAEIANAETFTFGNVDSSVYIDEVGRRAMCLIACSAVERVSPCGPCGSEIVVEQIGDSLAVVAFESCDRIADLLGEE